MPSELIHGYLIASGGQASAGAPPGNNRGLPPHEDVHPHRNFESVPILLGKGGYGSVFLGLELSTGRQFAVKKEVLKDAAAAFASTSSADGLLPVDLVKTSLHELPPDEDLFLVTINPDYDHETITTPDTTDFSSRVVRSEGSSLLQAQPHQQVQPPPANTRVRQRDQKDPNEAKRRRLKGIYREIRLLSLCKHPNIVKLHDFFQTSTHVYLVLEYAECNSLKKVLKSFDNRLPENLIQMYMRQILNAVEYLHTTLFVVHRDLKSDNLLLDKHGRVLLADFGISIKLAHERQCLRNVPVLGTPYWMAPELFHTQLLSTKSDIWSLGCVLLEMLTGKPPFYNSKPIYVPFELQGNPDLTKLYPSDISVYLKEVVRTMTYADFKIRGTATDIKGLHFFKQHLTLSSTYLQSAYERMNSRQVRIKRISEPAASHPNQSGNEKDGDLIYQRNQLNKFRETSADDIEDDIVFDMERVKIRLPNLANPSNRPSFSEKPPHGVRSIITKKNETHLLAWGTSKPKSKVPLNPMLLKYLEDDKDSDFSDLVIDDKFLYYLGHEQQPSLPPSSSSSSMSFSSNANAPPNLGSAQPLKLAPSSQETTTKPSNQLVAATTDDRMSASFATGAKTPSAAPLEKTEMEKGSNKALLSSPSGALRYANKELLRKLLGAGNSPPGSKLASPRAVPVTTPQGRKLYTKSARRDRDASVLSEQRPHSAPVGKGLPTKGPSSRSKEDAAALHSTFDKQSILRQYKEAEREKTNFSDIDLPNNLQKFNIDQSHLTNLKPEFAHKPTAL